MKAGQARKAQVGEVRQRADGAYRKLGPGRWERVKDGEPKATDLAGRSGKPVSMKRAADELRSAYGGGVAGLQAEVEAEVKVTKLGKDAIRERVSCRVRLKDGDADAGSLRTLVEKGKLVAYHDMVVVSKPYQGRGVSKELARLQDEAYRRIGVDRIELEADMTAGGYTWALHGYDFAVPEHRDKAMREVAHRMALLDAKRHDKVQVRTSQHLQRLQEMHASKEGGLRSWDLARMEYKGEKVGKQAMAGSDWDGVRSLDPASESYRVGAAYYGGGG
jgi:GNAT superfamily N-acetyltransferase